MQAYHNGADRYFQAPAGFAQQPQYYQQFPGYGYPQSGAPTQAVAQPYPMYPGGMPPPTPIPGRPRPLDREISRSATPGRVKHPRGIMKRTRTPERPPSSTGEPPRPVSRGRSSESIPAAHRVRTRSGSRPRFVAGTSSRPSLPPDA